MPDYEIRIRVTGEEEQAAAAVYRLRTEYLPAAGFIVDDPGPAGLPGVEVLAVVVGPDGEHRYVSTYCVHGDCGDCRRTCKRCHAVCLHGCHEAGGEAGP